MKHKSKMIFQCLSNGLNKMNLHFTVIRKTYIKVVSNILACIHTENYNINWDHHNLYFLSVELIKIKAYLMN